MTSNQFDDRRLFVMVLDDANTGQDMLNVQQVLRSVKRISNEIIDRLGPNDLMAVVFTMDNRRPQDFTNDRAKLHAAVDRFSQTGSIQGQGPSMLITMTTETLARVAEFLIDVPERRKALLYVGSGVPLDIGEAATPVLAAPPNVLSSTVDHQTHDSRRSADAGSLRSRGARQRQYLRVRR